MGINIQNDRGDTVMTIDQGGVRFGTGYSPVQYQFATSESGPWHSAMETNDKYRRESFDGGTTWGTPFQFRGTDGANGRPGSDASVTYNNIKAALQKAASTQTSFITADEMGAPNIYGGKIYGAEMYTNMLTLYPDTTNPNSTERGMQLIDTYNGEPYTFLKITYSPTLYWPMPGVIFSSPAEGGAKWDFSKTEFYGDISFKHADVTGITAVFA